MSDDKPPESNPNPSEPNLPGGGSSQGQPNKETPGVYSQNINYAPHISARIPESVVKGVFGSVALVLQSQHEMAIDFLQRLVQPHQLAARVIMPYSVLPSVVNALQQNLNNYRDRFATLPASPPPPPPGFVPPKIEEIYDALKITEDVLAACHANTVMITHSQTEFCFDFILDLFPRPTVVARVYLSAMQVPQFLDTLKRTLARLQQVPPHVAPPTGSPPNAAGPLPGGPHAPEGPAAPPPTSPTPQ